MLRLVVLSSLFVATSASALELSAARVAVWYRGETIAGEEFVAASEEVADYLTTLQRPTRATEPLVYNCQVKARVIEPSVWRLSGSDPNRGYVTVRTVYAIEGCEPRTATPEDARSAPR